MNKRTPSRFETGIGLGIFGVLGGIVLTIWLTEAQYDRGPYTAHNAFAVHPGENKVATASDANGQAILPFAVPAGAVLLTPPESFDRETISDKINGKAELYLRLGLKTLKCARYAPVAGSPDWIETCVYEMDSPDSAFAAFSTQRRPDGVEPGIGVMAYRSGQGLFLVVGNRYMEVVSARETPASLELALAWARMAVGDLAHPAKHPTDVLTTEGMIENSAQWLPKDAFGFDGLDRVAMARYKVGSAIVTAWIASTESPEIARRIAAKTSQALENMGAETIKAPADLPGAIIFSIMDMVEIFQPVGAKLIGVHEAPSLEDALAAVKMMNRTLLGDQQVE